MITHKTYFLASMIRDTFLLKPHPNGQAQRTYFVVSCFVFLGFVNPDLDMKLFSCWWLLPSAGDGPFLRCAHPGAGGGQEGVCGQVIVSLRCRSFLDTHHALRLGVTSQSFRRRGGLSYLDLGWGEGGGRLTRTVTLLSRVSVVLEK